MRMDKITTRLLQQFVMDVANEKRFNRKGEPMPPYAPKTVRNYITFISTVFDYAVRMQMLSDNPCRNVVIPSIRSKKRDIYSLEEVQQMLELFEQETEANYKYTIFFTLAAFTGLRRGELLGLEWKDIDFNAGSIYIQRQITRVGGEVKASPLKTKNAYRQIILPADVLKILKEKKDREAGFSSYVFSSPTGGPMCPDSMLNMLHRVLKRAGLPAVRFHDLRHPYVKLKTKKFRDFWSKKPTFRITLSSAFVFAPSETNRARENLLLHSLFQFDCP